MLPINYTGSSEERGWMLKALNMHEIPDPDVSKGFYIQYTNIRYIVGLHRGIGVFSYIYILLII